MGSCSRNAQATEADVSGAHHELLIHMHLDFCPTRNSCKKNTNARATRTSCRRRHQNHDRRGCRAFAPRCHRRRQTHWHHRARHHDAIDEEQKHRRREPGRLAEDGQWLEEASGAGGTGIQRTPAKWPPRPCPHRSVMRQKMITLMVNPTSAPTSDCATSISKSHHQQDVSQHASTMPWLYDTQQ